MIAAGDRGGNGQRPVCPGERARRDSRGCSVTRAPARPYAASVRRVVVIGAGIAGLGAAWELKRSGVEVVVLESEREPGGRMRSYLWEGTWIDAGAGETTGNSVEMRRTAEEFGVEIIPHHGNEHMTTRVYKRGEVHELDSMDPSAYLRYGAMSYAGRARMVAVAAALARHLRRSRDLPDDPRRGVWADHESLETWLGRVAPEFLEYAVEPLLAGQCSWDPGQASKGYFLHLFSSHGNVDLYTFKEGLGQLTRALAQHLDVRTGARATRLRVSDPPVRIEYEQEGRPRVIDADYAIVAVPGSRVLDFVEELDPVRRTFFRRVYYVPADSLLLRMPNPPQGLEGMVYFPRKEERDIARAGWDPYPTNPEDWLFTMLGKYQLARNTVDWSDERLYAAKIDALRRYWPTIGEAVEGSRQDRWREGIPTFPPGYCRDLSEFMAQPPLRAIGFAGDYLVGPATEYAFESGQAAARTAVRSLS